MKTQLSLLVACFVACLQGCSTGSVTPPPNPPTPPAPPTPVVKIVSPANDATLGTFPVTIQVSFTNGADPTSMQALLDGVDVTSSFSAADNNGIRTAILSRPQINLGKNQLLVTASSQQLNSDFFLTSPLGSAAAATMPSLVPITTRVVQGDGTKASDYYVEVDMDPNNPLMIQSPTPSDGSANGFQLVYLSRVDLSEVGNVAVTNTPPPNGFFSSFLFQALSNTPSGCGAAGCVLVIQSLNTIGYTPCAPDQNIPKDCTEMQTLLFGLGASARVAFAEGHSNHIAFSYIGNTPANVNAGEAIAGTFFESLTCNSSNYGPTLDCDGLGYPNTSFTAPTGAPPSGIGKISGALIRDNYNNYTFTQTAPPKSFSSQTDPSGLSHTFTVDGTTYSSSPLGNVQGGIHLLILNREDLSAEFQRTYPSSADGSAGEAFQVASDINGYKSYGNLFLVSAFGITTYSGSGRANWYSLSQVLGETGGTQQVFYQVNNPENNPANHDDYTLVGAFTDGSITDRSADTGLERKEIGGELSSIISRETEANPLSSDMEGMFYMNNQGYYYPKAFGHNLSLVDVSTSEILGASLLKPTPWPFPGSDQPGLHAAYNWISLQLCCTDIRAAYVNLNISPTVWLGQIKSLQYDASQMSPATQDDFNAMVSQLSTEFQYVALVRLFQNNLTALYQDQQANISLLLQDDSNKVLENLQVDAKTPVKPVSWLAITNQVFGLTAFVTGYLPGVGGLTSGVKSALTLGALVAGDAAADTNSAAGSPLTAQEESEEIATAELADQAASEFSTTLISLGNKFDRIVTDWGRLKTLGSPLLANQIQWDANSAGKLLTAYDVLYQRQLYAKLLPATNTIQYMPYVGDTQVPTKGIDNDAGDTCDMNDYQRSSPQILYYPNGSPNTDKHAPQTTFPNDYQWGYYSMVQSIYTGEGCPGNKHPFPSTFGLFQPVSPNNPDSLGAYRYWFYTRGDFQVEKDTSITPCYDSGDCD
jgi:hypothetical protein